MRPLVPPRENGWTATQANGCTEPGCGTQNTVVLDAKLGRRCADHHPDAHTITTARSKNV